MSGMLENRPRLALIIFIAKFSYLRYTSIIVIDLKVANRGRQVKKPSIAGAMLLFSAMCTSTQAYAGDFDFSRVNSVAAVGLVVCVFATYYLSIPLRVILGESWKTGWWNVGRRLKKNCESGFFMGSIMGSIFTISVSGCAALSIYQDSYILNETELRHHLGTLNTCPEQVNILRAQLANGRPIATIDALSSSRKCRIEISLREDRKIAEKQAGAFSIEAKK